MSAVLRSACGEIVVDLEVGRWRESASADELELLARYADPVLDIGCGPGRIVEALAVSGRPCLGVDSSPHAVREARRRGIDVLERSVFEPLPGERRWATVILLDGNIGIGGDPVVLLSRVTELLAADGMAVVEVEPPGATSTTMTVRVEDGDGTGGTGPWFEWARLAVNDVGSVAADAGLQLVRTDRVHPDRWFATLALSGADR